MAIHKGEEGVVKVGANTVAETTDWSFTQSVDPIETTNLASTARTYVAGKPSGSGSVTCHWDETDTSGQGALDIGNTVSLSLYPGGSSVSGASFSAIITTVDFASGGNDGLAGATFNFQVSGAVTWS